VARAQRAAGDDGVFLNVAFDSGYRKLFHALVFAVHECGFVARCALEADDGTQVRLEKLYGIIGECLFAVHDISRTSLDSVNRLPRFNSPIPLHGAAWPQAPYLFTYKFMVQCRPTSTTGAGQ
jgi:hypothetical protein